MTTDTEEDIEEGSEEGLEVDLIEEQEDKKAKVEKHDDVSISDRAEENEELAGADTDEEREAIRARRRDERKRRKQIGKEKDKAKDRLVASLQMQVKDLAERLSHVDKRQSGTDFAKLEEELNQAIATASEAQEHLKNSAEASDWEGLAKANDLYYTARRRAEYLAGVKKNLISQNKQQTTHIDQRVVQNASKWMNENKWYSHNGGDMDSIVTKAVDDQLASEGYDPRTNEYWEELNDRLSEKLPHRFGKARVNGKSSSSPPVGGSGKNSAASAGGNGSTKFFLSAERVKALKDAGVWDDPAARDKMIKRYRDYDKQHAGDKK